MILRAMSTVDSLTGRYLRPSSLVTLLPSILGLCVWQEG